MRRIAVLSVALAIAMLVWADTTQAQDDQNQGAQRQGRGQRGQGGQGRQGRGGGRNSLEGLLQIDEVKTEIDLTEDQGTQITEYVDGLERPGFGGGNFQDMTAEERQAAMEEFAAANAKRNADIRKKVESVLLEPQMTRLNQLYVQSLGFRGLTDAWISAQLELSEDQIAKLNELSPARGGFGGGRGQGGGRAGRGGQGNDELEESMMAVLTDTQKTKYEEMKGEAFEFPARGGRGGAGGRGGRGRGGAGGGGGNGGGGGGF